jgi:hypothetical protein
MACVCLLEGHTREHMRGHKWIFGEAFSLKLAKFISDLLDRYELTLLEEPHSYLQRIKCFLL